MSISCRLSVGKHSKIMDSTSLPSRPIASKAKKEKPSKQPKGATTPKSKRVETTKPAADDPQSMFKVGFLSDVYQEKSIESGAIDKVVTRVSCSNTEIAKLANSFAVPS